MSSKPDPVQLDPNVVAAKQGAMYRNIIAQLVEANAQLEAYVEQLLAHRDAGQQNIAPS